uniref:Gag-Pol polyprotein n=1 Tax=Tanacetum cinerariifolium TaxID=118510 RepID=A0A699J406_TANCI|nr:hypothetical protein [Tanacetum cinerariifolium]
MYNNIMAAGSRDRPPMLVPRRYAQWQSCFMRYVDTRSNGDALRKCILQGPYTLSTVTIPGYNRVNLLTSRMSRLVYFESLVDGESTESYYSIFYKMMNEMVRNQLEVATIQVYVQFLQQLQPEWSRFVTVVKQAVDLDKELYHKLFDILKHYQNEVNEIHAKKIAKNANPLAAFAVAQQYPNTYYQAPKSHKSYAPPSKQSSSTRSPVSTRHNGKKIAKLITPPSESTSEEDNDPKQAYRDKDIQKNLAIITKYFKKIYKPTNNYNTPCFWVIDDVNKVTINQLEVPTIQVYVQFLQQLQPEWSRFVTVVKQAVDLDKELYHKLFDILKHYQNKVNEIHAKKIAKNANPLAAFAAAQQYPNTYYPAPKTFSNTKNKNVDTSPRYKNNNQTGQFGNQRTMTIVGARETVGSQETKMEKYYTYQKEKMLMCKQAEKGVPLQAEQADWLEDIDEEVDEQEWEAHYMYMAKIQEVHTTDSGPSFDAEPLEKVHSEDDYNVFFSERHHSEQTVSINNTCVVEKVNSNVILDSSDMCDNDNQADQNAKECNDERDVLANLIKKLKLDTDENKKI